MTDASGLTPALGSSRDIAELLGFMADTTQRQPPAEPNQPKALRLNEERFRLLLESIRDYALFMLDPDGRVSTWNAGAERLKGFRADEIVGQHFSVFYPVEDRAHGRPSHALRVAADEGRFEEDGWRVRKDGSQFWANVVITALRDSAGRLVGFAKMMRDLTERRRAEEERILLAREQIARAAAEAAVQRATLLAEVSAELVTSLEYATAPQRIAHLMVPRLADWCVVLLLEDGSTARIGANVHRNPAKQADDQRLPNDYRIRPESDEALLRAIQTRQALLVGRGPSVLLQQVAELSGRLSLLRAVGPGFYMYLPLVARDVVLGVMALAITESERPYTADDLALAEEAAGRCALAMDNARLYDEALHALRQREEFLAVAAHELKTPLTSLRLSAQLFRARPGAAAGAVTRELGERIDEQSEKLSRLVDQLLDVSRIEAGRLMLNLEPHDLAALVRTSAQELQGRTTHPILVRAPEEFLAEIDPLRIEQVLMNLFDNAAKFSPADSSIEVELTGSSAGQARLSIRDHGAGVQEEDRPHLFERFYQVESRRHTAGMGLGLFISRQIVEMHGGELTAEFPPDGGTRLVMTLPIHDASE